MHNLEKINEEERNGELQVPVWMIGVPGADRLLHCGGGILLPDQVWHAPPCSPIEDTHLSIHIGDGISRSFIMHSTCALL